MIANREVHAEGWRVRLNLARQVLRLEVPEAVTYGERDGRQSAGPPIAAVLPPPEGGPVSAATLLLKAKQFDDRLYAAVELAAQQGAGRFAGKATLLRNLAATLAAGLRSSDIAAATMVHVACELGGVPVAVPEALVEPVRIAKDDFLRDDLLSKPVGWYTWTPELSAIFRQDRFLQQPLDRGCADALTRALEQTPGASDAYDACLRLNARLTNPPKPLGLREIGKRPPFFPPSRSHEVTLFERLYQDQAIPKGFDLMAELIRRVRSGEINLEPTATSGWYDHQTWSLEPLLLPERIPEAAHLELGKRYRKHLEDLFRGTLALTRETHAKRASGGAGGYGGPRERPIWVNPALTVEPLPTLYARRAAGYRFVRAVLEEAFGDEALKGMPRLTPEGMSTAGLLEELTWVEMLFEGAAITASRELGMASSTEGDPAARCFSAWRAKLQADADVRRDARMMIPVFFDVQRKKTMVWAFLGWRTFEVDVVYRVPPKVLSVEPLIPLEGPPPVLFSGDRYQLAVPVVAEVYVKRLLDRNEFRRHCDCFKHREAILRNLQ